MICFKKRKAQLFTQDFILSIVMFLAIVSLGNSAWENVMEKTSSDDTIGYMQQKAFYITDIIIKTRGYPEDWNSTDVELAGLSGGKNHMLSIEKIDMFGNVSYSQCIDMWDIPGYGFNLTIRNSTDIILSGGAAIPANATVVLPYSRIVNIDYGNHADKGKFEFIFWKEKM